MKRFILSRLIQSVACILVVSFAVFFLVRLTGDPIEIMAPEEATEEQIRSMRAEMGLDKSMTVQYRIFLTNAVKGDFGKSIRTGRPVLQEVLVKLPASLELAGAAVFLAVIIGVPFGIYAAAKRGSVFDVLAKAFAALGQSVPAFWSGIMFVMFFSVLLGLLPSGGRGGILNLVMPAFTLSWAILAGVLRLTYTSMVEALSSNYVLLARAKGLSKTKVLWKHAFKNASIPVLTYVSIITVALLSGAVAVEIVFSWPGIGRLLMQAVIRRDFPIVQAIIILASTLFIIVNLIVDILYAYLNPKIRYYDCLL